MQKLIVGAFVYLASLVALAPLILWPVVVGGGAISALVVYAAVSGGRQAYRVKGNAVAMLIGGGRGFLMVAGAFAVLAIISVAGGIFGIPAACSMFHPAAC